MMKLDAQDLDLLQDAVREKVKSVKWNFDDDGDWAMLGALIDIRERLIAAIDSGNHA